MGGLEDAAPGDQGGTGIQVPPDNKNSGQTLAQLIAEKNNPVADIAYFGVGFAIQAKDAGVLEPYKPAKTGTRFLPT